jgi:hypothetical protein
MVCKVQLGCNSQPVDLKCNLKRDRLPAFDVISPEMHTFSGLSSCPSIRRGVLTVAQPSSWPGVAGRLFKMRPCTALVSWPADIFALRCPPLAQAKVSCEDGLARQQVLSHLLCSPTTPLPTIFSLAAPTSPCARRRSRRGNSSPQPATVSSPGTPCS